MKKYRYNIQNLDCANCARKIEESLNKNSKFKNVTVNFATSKLSYESNEEISLKELNKIVKKIEPESTIFDINDVNSKKEYHIWILILGIIFCLFGIILDMPYNLNLLSIILSYILLLHKPFLNAIHMLIKNKTINENALITISCIGAFLINQRMEGIMVVSLYILGKILEEKAINKTRKSVKYLINIKQDYANLKINNDIKVIDVDDIKINDILIIKKGEKIPVDGILISDNTKLDTSMLTGESELVFVNKNDEILSGSINDGEVVEMKATTLFKDSTVSKILELLEEATDKKSNMETLVSKLSKIYTPIVLLLAVLVSILLPLIFNISLSESIYRGLTFLVISCPCAIAISVPLSYFTGIGVSSKNGILIKGSNYLDNLAHIKKIIFDKTGTLTTGSFKITNIEIFDKDYTQEDIIEILIKGELFSSHPIAKSIANLYDKPINNNDIINYKELPGMGISYELNDKKIKVGTKKVCKDCTIETSIHLNIDNHHIASINIDDGIKENAKETINYLKKLNIKTYMFTGDKKEVALEIGKILNIDEVKYEMLPTDKYKEYENIANREIVAFVGDGINDAPVLKRADIGISMGNVGSQSAILASDIVIMTDEIKKISKSIDISKYTNYIIKQNLLFAIVVKISILFLSVFGLTSMWFAVFADTGVTLITIINTLRIMRKFKN